MDQDSAKLEVVMDTAEIEQVASYKLLGLIINEDLTYKVYVNERCNKLSERLGLLHHINSNIIILFDNLS